MKNKGYIWIALIFSGIAFISWNDTLTVVLACMSIAAGFLAIKSGEKYQLIAVLGSGFSIFVLLMLLFRSEEYITVPAEKMLDLKKAEMLREEAHASGNMDEYTEFVLGYIMDEDRPYELGWVNATAFMS